MRPAPGEVLHFSEDPTIELFRPYVAKTAGRITPYVWAVGHDRAPGYWFPRQCPRAMAWVGPSTTPDDQARIIGAGGGTRVHAVEYGWLEAMRSVELYAYRLPAAEFELHDAAFVATSAVRPLGPAERVGDLFALHDAAGIQLRVLNRLHDFWDQVVASTLEWSGIRLRNAKP
ncbi:hypothetical protein HPO96_30265 [Kribbella sandramycini]|uniref:Uncharacterized protein n=1 Tax=Kribbella sandramycini TaxID=60450 RepID=A0A7Y4P3V5_9ACTN|nr:DUF6886 family protein [Kribbella sandramycini]MBB6566816.1 hypothetical protein [Kribbella sandramycini]NOL44539.1 hypothetical protein [Kribbella sandramycini]